MGVEYVTIREAQAIYKISRSTVERWMRRGYLMYQKFGRTVRIILVTDSQGRAGATPDRPRSGRRVRTKAKGRRKRLKS